MTRSSISPNRLRYQRLLSALLVLVAVLLAYLAIVSREQLTTFKNPVAFCFSHGVLYVVEKEHNTVIVLDHLVAGAPMVAKEFYPIEPDDPEYYYMVRRIYPGPQGLVVQSYIYRHGSHRFVGYRFSQYASLNQPPTPILTIYLENPQDYPEVAYDFDQAGNHYFVNNCEHQHNIWRISASGRATISGGKIPGNVEQLGEMNQALDKWEDLAVNTDGRIYVTSGASGRIVEYSPQGQRLREIGQVGFGENQLIAPGEVFFARLPNGGQQFLTVASKGNRSWVQFHEDGTPIHSLEPLRVGYHQYDVSVATFYNRDGDNRIYSFDLANKSLITCGEEGCGLSTSYLASQWARAGVLLFGAVLLGVLALLLPKIATLTAKTRIPFFFKMLLLFVPLLVLSAGTVGESVRAIMIRGIKLEMIRRSANLAQAVVNNLQLSDLENIERPEDRSSPVYEKVYRTISRIVDTSQVDQTPKWILHKIHEGHYYFGINIWRGAIFQPFVVPSDRTMFFRVLSEKTCQSGRYTDDQGEWFSYLCPVLDGEGRPFYVLELYRPVEQLERASREASHKVLTIIGVTILVALILVLVSSFIFTRPLRKLIKKTSFISKGDFDQQIEVRSRDELGELADAFDQMVIDLRKYIAELARTTAEKERIQSELRLAHDMQQEILPKVFPPLPKADTIAIFAQMQPAKEVGGDFYDFFPVDDDHMAVVVGDVTGKGVPAGLFMMRVRAMLRSSAMGTLSAAEALARVNQVIFQENPSATFATMFYFVCNIRSGTVTFCNAGHNPPVLLQAGRAQFLSSASKAGRGLPVGALEDGLYADGTLSLGLGEALVIYTDGVTESSNACKEMFGEERLRQILEANAGLEPESLCRQVFAGISEHQGDAEQFDDIAVLIFKFGIGKVSSD